MVDGEDLTDIVFFTDEERDIQYRLCVSEFRDKKYLSIRKWFQGYDETWVPTKEGFSIPYELHTVTNLFVALCSLLSEAEVLSHIVKGIMDEGLPKETR